MDKPSFKEIEAVLFDFEGTLVDFQWDLEGAVRDTVAMLTTLGFPGERLRGKKYSVLMAEAMRIASGYGQRPEKVRAEIGVIYDRFDEDAFGRWSLRPGARGFLSSLNQAGIKIALVTNVGRLALEKGLSKLALKDFFRVVVSRNDVQALKPSGEGIISALFRLGVKGDQAFYVGDSLDDIRAAREAALKAIILTGGEYPEEAIAAAKPDFIVNGFDELLLSLKETRL